jgi:hypothetical protein
MHPLANLAYQFIQAPASAMEDDVKDEQTMTTLC